MTPEFVIGIDIGTRTTVIAYWRRKDRSLNVCKIQGDARIPSAYYADEPNIPKEDLDEMRMRNDAVTDFKINFWGTNKPTAEARGRLLGWLERICVFLSTDLTPDFLEKGHFCFTYPAQRHLLQDDFRKLISDAGFPEDRLEFLDEPTAVLYSQAKLRSLPGRGLIVDIGAGTTDLALLDNVAGSANVDIIDISSIRVAGNDFTLGSSKLLSGSTSRAAFFDYQRRKPFASDRIKEDFSDYYRNKASRSSPFYRNLEDDPPGIGKFTADNFEAFKASAEDNWRQMSGEITKQLKAAHLTDRDLSFVVLAGGGSLHSGLRALLEDRFGSKIIPSNDPQLLVAKGAASFAKTRIFPDQGKEAEIQHVVSASVRIVFPPATKQEELNILHLGQTVPLSRSLTGWIPVRLDSNWFDPEGHLYLYVGDLPHDMGLLDIKWSASTMETKMHPGDLRWTYDAAKGRLDVSLTLNNVAASQLTRSIRYVASAILTVPGRFNDAQMGVGA